MASVLRKTVALAVLGMTAALVAGSAAQAQDAAGDSVLGRPRPGYDPLGIDLFAGPNDPGSPFVLYPTLDISGGYDDNVFREENKQDDFFLRVSPGLALVSDWVNHGLSLAARADIARYEEFNQNDSTTFQIVANGFVDVALESKLYASGTFERAADSRDDVNNPGDDDLVKSWVNTQTVGFSTQEGDLISITEASRSSTNYIDNNSNQDDRDYVLYGVRQRLGYEFQPGVALFVEGSYNWRRYAESVDDFGFERNSQGWQVRGGMQYDAAGVIAAELSAGYLSQTYEDDRFGKTSGFAIDGDILWNPSELITIRGGAGTSVQETTLQGASGGYTTYGTLGFDYDLADSLIFTSTGTFTNVDYEPATGFSARNDKIWQASAGLIWLINEYFSARVDYTYTTRNSNVAGEDFNDNTVLLTLHSQL